MEEIIINVIKIQQPVLNCTHFDFLLIDPDLQI